MHEVSEDYAVAYTQNVGGSITLMALESDYGRVGDMTGRAIVMNDALCTNIHIECIPIDAIFTMKNRHVNVTK